MKKSAYMDPYEINLQELKYHDEDKLKEGAYGVVYRGTWNAKEVAIKIVIPGKQKLEDCKNEKNFLQACTHPNIIRFLGYHDGSSKGNQERPQYTIVTEYMPKGDLADFIDNKPCPEWSLRYSILRGVTQSIAYLHHMNIIHRDIKPQNVLLGNHDEVKLCDFGLARKEEDCVAEFIGTPEYVAPEVLKFKPHTKKSDIYSLGITFWETAVWAQPYEKKSNQDIYDMILAKKREHIPDTCPQKIAKLIKRCWAHKQIERPEVEKVSEKLEKFKPK